MKRIGLSLLLLVSLWIVPHPSEAILGVGDLVYDTANHFENIITAAQTTAMVLNQIIDLTPLDDYSISDSYGEDLATLQELASQAALVGFDLESLQAQITALFDLESAPLTSYEYRLRQHDIHLAVLQGYSYAMRTQTLISTAIRTVDHLIGLINQVSGLFGTLSVGQTLSQQEGKLHQLLAEANVQRSAFERAKSQEGLAPGVLIQGIANINDQMMSDHPR